MTDRSKAYPRVTRLINAFGDWLRHRQEIGELQAVETGEFRRIAHELGVTSAGLAALVRQGPHAADDMSKMLAALGIDADALERIQPMVYRDMERVCAGCIQKHRCHHELDAGTAAAHYESYCLNAPTVAALTLGAS